MTEGQILQPGEHPFPTKYAIRRATLRIEPAIYLDALMRDFVTFGGHIVIRKFDTPHDLMSLQEPVIANCSGLGSRDLFGDEELVPLKGQLTILVPQPEVNYRTSGGVNLPPTPGIGIHDAARRWDRSGRHLSEGCLDDGAGGGRAPTDRRRAHRAFLANASAVLTQPGLGHKHQSSAGSTFRSRIERSIWRSAAV